MIRNIKALGTALIAAAAMATVAASAAQAFEFHATTGQNFGLFGERLAQHNQFRYQIGGGQMECTQSLLEGTVTGSGMSQTTFQELTLTPTHTNCIAFGLASTWDMNGCKYTITNKLNQTTVAKRGTLDIAGCTAGKAIQITAVGGCQVTFPEQTAKSQIGFQNRTEGEGAVPHDVTMQLELQGLTYETHNCAALGIPENTVLFHDGSWSGGATLRARTNPETELVTHNGHQYQKLKQNGSLVGLSIT